VISINRGQLAEACVETATLERATVRMTSVTGTARPCSARFPVLKAPLKHSSKRQACTLAKFWHYDAKMVASG